MACIIDMSLSLNEHRQPTFQDFKRFNKSGPDLENQLAVIEEYHEATRRPLAPLAPLAKLLSRVGVLSFLPIFGSM
jgi:hypothetical protein